MALSAVLIDSREPDWLQGLRFGGVPVSVGFLESGDLLALCEDGESLIIERKTASDLLNSLRDDRLFVQLLGMRDVSQWCYLVITGTLQPGPKGQTYADGRETGWLWAAVQGALITTQEMGVRVVHSCNDQDYEAAVIRLANRSRDLGLIPLPREFDLMNTQETFLAGFPNIAAERVQLLLQHCGTPAWALHWLTDESPSSSHIPGIALGIKHGARKTLGLTDNTMLAVVSCSTEEVIQSSKEEKT